MLDDANEIKTREVRATLHVKEFIGLDLQRRVWPPGRAEGLSASHALSLPTLHPRAVFTLPI